jgi:hypothetical protein
MLTLPIDNHMGKPLRIQCRSVPEFRIQDELETMLLRPNLSISGRNMHQIWTDGKSIVQLARVAH